MIRQNEVVVDLGAIKHNYHTLAARMPKGVRVMPVVKADAYGHGMQQVARTVVHEGADRLAVALCEEGVRLRECGIACQILVLGAATQRAAEPAILNDLTQTVFDVPTVEYLDELAQELGKDALVNIKLDTGMGRIGLRTEEEARALAEALARCPRVRPTGIYTHFADADALAKQGRVNDFTREQLERFKRLRAFFPAGLCCHVANSAAELIFPEAYFDCVREGVSLYGYPPVKTDLAFQRALRWVTEVVHVKEIPAGATVSYGRTFTAPRDMRVATVAVGYGDGYHRAGSNRAKMLVRGQMANVVGRVCMDQTMLDVTEIPGVSVGDEVVLIGRQGEQTIDAEMLASWCDTISYEVLLAVTARVPRRYIDSTVEKPDVF